MNKLDYEKFFKEKARNFAVKVQPIYELLNWKWLDTINNGKIPNVDDIEKTIIDLSGYLLVNFGEEDASIKVSTGGLSVGFEQDEEGNIEYPYIRFIVSELGFNL